jgi:23S rRNA (pseudouridine1915-N3)-methyltransferase
LRRCGAPSWTRPPATLSELRLIAVGRLGRGPEAELFARYNARLRPPLLVTEVAEGRGSAAEIKRHEAGRLLAALPSHAFAVALDLGGRAPESEALAALLGRWLESGRPVCFLIGGAEGLDASVIAHAEQVLSLGPLTWPHLLVRVMLAEQLFRARAIAAGHPYHRAGRP